MNFGEARIAMDIFERYQCGQNRDWGDEENRRLPIEGRIEFGHEQCWISIPRTTSVPTLAADERQQLEEAGWFLDEENGAWSHL